jgi:hypothetical protein
MSAMSNISRISSLIPIVGLLLVSEVEPNVAALCFIASLVAGFCVESKPSASTSTSDSVEGLLSLTCGIDGR